MTQVTLLLEPAVALFYTHIAQATGISLEQVLSDALFKLAGELSLEALQIGHIRVESIGGGDIRIEGQSHLEPPEV